MKWLSVLVFVLSLAACNSPSLPSPAATMPAPLPTSASTPQAPVNPGLPSSGSQAPAYTPSPAPPPVEPAAESAGPAAAAVIAPTGAGEDCINKAGFFGDVTIPDNTPFTQGVEFVKTWKVRNEGTCLWGEGYAVVFAYGEQMDAPLSAPIPAAAPGDIIEVSVPMTSPRRDGVFTGNWQFQDAQGNRFGLNSAGQDYMWVMIAVGTKMDAPPPPAPVSTACDAVLNPEYIGQLLELINQARAQDGQPALSLNGALSAAAQDHSLDMACHSLLSHVGTNGSSWRERIAGKGYNAAAASENIYAGDPQYGGDAAGAMDWWLNSTVHRNNILSSKVTEIGIGYAYVSGSEYGGYFTLNFGRPK